MPDLPAQLSFFTVTGKLVKAVLDSVDAGTDPDMVALQGQLTFSPEIGKRLHNGQLAGGGRITVGSATPPLIVVVDPVPVALGADGSFSVKLLAPDDPDIAPSGWTWTVTFALTGATMKAFSFTGAAGSTVDLANVAPVEISTGGVTFINEAAASAAAAEASAVSAALSASLVGAPADVAVAAIVGNPGSATSGALSSTYAPAKGANLQRSIGALGNGRAQTWGVLGDSKTDPTTPGNTGGGPVEKLAALVATRFGVTPTISNQANSGHTAARQFLDGSVGLVVAAAPDLTFIMLGNNDEGATTYGPYAAGYNRDASIAAVERMIAYIRDANPKAEFVLIGTGPYSPISTGSNTNLIAYNKRMRELAAATGAEFIDCYAPFAALGDFSALMYDGTHQGPTGNDLYAATMIEHFPLTYAGPASPITARATKGLAGIDKVSKGAGLLGYGYLAAPAVTSSLSMVLTGAGWTVNGIFDQTSTVADSITVSGPAITELLANIDLASVAVVDFYLDDVLQTADVNLNQLGKNTTNYWIAPFTGLNGAAHSMKIVLKSGTLRVSMVSGVIAAPAGVGSFPPESRVAQVFVGGTVVALTAAYQDIAPGVTIPLPAGWGSMDLHFTGRALFRSISSTAAIRRIDLALRENGVAIQGTRQSSVPVQTSTFYLPYVPLEGSILNLNRDALMGIIAKLDVADTVSSVSCYADVLLVRKS